MSDCPNRFCDFRDVVVPNLRDEIREKQTTIRKLQDVNTGLVETVVGLREALEEYGHHMDTCSWYNLSGGKGGTLVRDDCDCGLDMELNT